METDRCDIAHDAIQKRHVISWFGLVHGDMERPENKDGIDKKRPAKASLRLSVLQCFLQGTRGLAW